MEITSYLFPPFNSLIHLSHRSSCTRARSHSAFTSQQISKSSNFQSTSVTTSAVFLQMMYPLKINESVRMSLFCWSRNQSFSLPLHCSILSAGISEEVITFTAGISSSTWSKQERKTSSKLLTGHRGNSSSIGFQTSPTAYWMSAKSWIYPRESNKQYNWVRMESIAKCGEIGWLSSQCRCSSINTNR